MAEFYLWPRAACYFVTFLLALCVLCQTLAVSVTFLRHHRGRSEVFQTLFEVIILVHILIVSLPHGQNMQSYDMGIITETGYVWQRAVIFFALAAVSFFCAVFPRSAGVWQRAQSLFAFAAASLTLPAADNILKGAFAYAYVFAVLFWLVRGFALTVSRYREIKTHISALSVKSAMDSLHTGIMFCENDGFAVLSNTRMRNLTLEITGEIQRNGREFFSLLSLGEINPGCRLTWFEGNSVCLLPGGKAWMFTTGGLTINGKKYHQLTATDVTEYWKLKTELEPQSEELIKRQKELNAEIENIHILSRERETQNAKMRAHDILGARLTFMLRAVRSNQPLNYALLKTQARELLDELGAEQNKASPKDRLNILKNAFESIGVEIVTEGELPDDTETGRFAADVIREAVTNAVRHAFATKVNVNFGVYDTGEFKLTVKDNGRAPQG
jgi:signal transduction histidine kinase